MLLQEVHWQIKVTDLLVEFLVIVILDRKCLNSLRCLIIICYFQP